jgi:acyl dehydratase
VADRPAGEQRVIALGDQTLGGPVFEDLEIGQAYAAPSVTLTEGLAAAHQAVLGDRLLMPLSHPLTERVLGPGPVMAHPALVWDIAIGQSTVVTQRVKANLFYRGLCFSRVPRIGDTLTTITEVAALRDNAPRTGRGPTGLARLRMTCTDHEGRTILTGDRCAMLPYSSEDERRGRADDVTFDHPGDLEGLRTEAEAWDADDLPVARVPDPEVWHAVPGGDRVVAAPLLTRLSLNLAVTHGVSEDASLVYGGHVIGTAFAQLTRAIPGIVAVAGWPSCDHRAPVREGDILTSAFRVEGKEPRTWGPLRVLALSVRTSRMRSPDDAAEVVLDWRLDVLVR